MHCIIILHKPYDVNHLYYYKHVLSDMVFIFQKQGKETYVFIKLFKQDETKINKNAIIPKILIK